MTRTRRTVEISDALWDALELMSREMSVDRDSLMNQALFTFARFNGYVTPGAVAPHARPAPGAPATSVPPVAQPLASPPGAVRRTQAAAPPPAAQPGPERAQEPDDQPRMATGSIDAVTPARPAKPPPPPGEPPRPPLTPPTAKADTTAPNDPAPTPPSANAAAIADPAPTPPSPAPTGAVDDAEPPEGEVLADGLVGQALGIGGSHISFD
jgi:hypothetical protein